MERTRKGFGHDELIQTVREGLEGGLKRYKAWEVGKNAFFSHQDCLMSGLALFTFKYPSLLQFQNHMDEDEKGIRTSIQRLFRLKDVPSDTQLRERLDPLDPAIFRPAFKGLFAQMQRGNVLQDYQFQGRYLISLDGTGYFSSPSIHCENCCKKEHKDGSITYYHQLLGAALVHPLMKQVFPFYPEMIKKEDGATKNDCERNAAKRWIQTFKADHPHLKTTLLADGLSSNTPFIEMLKENDMRFILVAKEGDHGYMFDYVNAADSLDAPLMVCKEAPAVKTYQIMQNVPLTSAENCFVTVVRYKETDSKSKKTRTWVWVTDLEVSERSVKDFVKAGRSRWKIENETFNTIKTQGYHFEHNFGHGNANLSWILANEMLLAFFIDQIIEALDKNFRAAFAKMKRKIYLWEKVRSFLHHYILGSFEALYKAITGPPTKQELV